MKTDMKIVAVFVALALAMSSCALPAAAFPLQASDATVASAVAYLKSTQQANGGFGDSAASCYADMTPFAVMAAVAAGEDPHSWKAAGSDQSAVDFLKEVSVPCLNGSSIPTNYATTMLALAAVGDSPQDVKGRNLTAELLSMQAADGSFNTSVWITDQEWAVLALAASGCNLTAELNASVDYLISQQRADGGFGAWCPDASSSCPDETSLGVMALEAAGRGDSEAVQRALSRIMEFETADAGIDPGWGMGANVDSDAWAVMAVAAAGNDFSAWAKSSYALSAPGSGTAPVLSNSSFNATISNAGNLHLFGHMAGLQSADGSFSYFKPVQDTGYAVAALLGQPFPVCAGCGRGPAAGDGPGQEFSVSFSQNGSWAVTLSASSVSLGAGDADVTLHVVPPPSSAWTADNVTVNVTGSDGASRYASIVLSAAAACGNGACEPGEGCSACASDCGSCPGPAPSAQSGSGGVGGGGGGGAGGAGVVVCTLNGACDPGETAAACPSDCRPVATTTTMAATTTTTVASTETTTPPAAGQAEAAPTGMASYIEADWARVAAAAAAAMALAAAAVYFVRRR